MSARDLLREGKLAEAVTAAVSDVKAAPGDVRARIFLFELLAAAGDFERARTHLEVVADRSPEMADGVRSYQAVLTAEVARARLFATGQGAPQRMTLHPLDPEPNLTALRRLLAGAPAEAASLLTPQEEARAPRSGTVDGRPFGDFRDADDLLAPFLEVITNGLYGWIPWVQIGTIAFEPPQYLRDLLWRSATVTLVDGASATMFVPVRYPGSERHDDVTLRLGRATDWRADAGVTTGIGQHTFLAGDEACPILDATAITFTS